MMLAAGLVKSSVEALARSARSQARNPSTHDDQTNDRTVRTLMKFPEGSIKIPDHPKIIKNPQKSQNHPRIPAFPPAPFKVQAAADDGRSCPQPLPSQRRYSPRLPGRPWLGWLGSTDPTESTTRHGTRGQVMSSDVKWLEGSEGF